VKSETNPGSLGNRREVRVVGDHDRTILGEMNVRLQDVGTGINRSLKGPQGVLCVIARGKPRWAMTRG
jgi:hypothetical protein